MLIVGNSILSDEIVNTCFCCDTKKCKGICCVEGDYGAPITEKEKEIIKNLLPKILPILQPKAIETIKKYNFYALDNEKELCTQIIDGKDCVFCIKNEKRYNLCAFQKLYSEGKSKFIKPLSCHLYPIRISDFEECSALNYHCWDICKYALELGKKKNIPIYKYCKEPLIRRFGVKWYNDLEQAVYEHKDYYKQKR